MQLQQLTLDNVISYLYALTKHKQINSFFYGPTFDVDNKREIVYPMFAVVPQPFIVHQNFIESKLRMYLIDKVQQGDENRFSVHSQTFQTLLDLRAYIYKDFSQWLLPNDESPGEPLWENFDDYTAGWYLDMSLKFDNIGNVCDIPGLTLTGQTYSQIPYTSITPSIQFYVQSVGAIGNLFTGGTESNPIIEIVDNPFFVSLSAETIYSGSTNLYDIFETVGSQGFEYWTSGTGTNSLVQTYSNNYVSGNNSIVVGGQNNRITSQYSTIGNGTNNSTSDGFSTILNGSGNKASGYFSSVLNGSGNYTSAGVSTILNGINNTATGRPYASILNGIGNKANGGRSTVINGSGNIVYSYYSMIGNGSGNNVSGQFGSVLNGRSNLILDTYSTILNGKSNTTDATSSNSTIVGGTNNYLSGASNSTIISLNNITGTSSNTVYMPFVNSLSGVTSYGPIISGSTDLYNIFLPIGYSGFVQSVGAIGNLFTGGTDQNPIINLTPSPSFSNLSVSGNGILNTLSATSLTATTLYGTGSILNVDSSVNVYGNIMILGTASTFNTQTVQTESNQLELNLSGSHVSALYGGITILSGQSSGSPSNWTIDINGNWSANTQIIAGQGINSNGVIQSGGTDLYDIFQEQGTDVLQVLPGNNINIGGTLQFPVVNLVDSPFVNNLTVSGTEFVNIISATTFSASTGTTKEFNVTDTLTFGNTLYVGENNITGVITSRGSVGIVSIGDVYDNGFETYIQVNDPAQTINLNATHINLNGSVIDTNGFNVSHGAISSGGTNLYNIFQQSGTSVVGIEAGSNIVTGGTLQNTIVSLVPSPSVNNFTVSGQSNEHIVSATTLSAGTIISGSTNLYQIFPIGTTTASGTSLGYVTGVVPLDSTFLGYQAGLNANQATMATFVGHQAGSNATSASTNTFIGYAAGVQASNSSGSVFVGYLCGYQATNASLSTFMGNNAGQAAAGAHNSTFIGNDAGNSATSASTSVFIGERAGASATFANNSTFLGRYAGNGATSAATSIFIGAQAGQSDSVNNIINGSSILIGNNTSTGGFKNSIAIGNAATNTATNQLLIASVITNYNMAGVGYTMPSSQGITNTVLTNNGSGTLTWSTGNTSFYSSTPSNPSTTTSLSGVMMGLSGTVTPNVTGRINLNVIGSVNNNTAADGSSMQIRYGTGSFPVNGSNLTGTASGAPVSYINDNITGVGVVYNPGTSPFTLATIITGLTVGTKYWVDISLESITGGISSIINPAINIQEF